MNAVALLDDLDRLAAAWPGLLALARHPAATRSVSAVSGSPANVNIAALDLLASPDHDGHPAAVDLIVAAEAAVRAALGHSTPTTTGPTRVPHALQYLSVHISGLSAWTPAAAAVIYPGLWDETLSRVDPARIRLDYDLARRPLLARVEQAQWVIADPQSTGEEVDQAEQDAADVATGLDMLGEYVDFEGRVYDAITTRFETAARDEAGFCAWLAVEVARVIAVARALLGVSGHSTRPLVACPMCSGPLGLSRDDPDTAECTGCGRRLRLRSGEADGWFGAFRAAGWSPAPWRPVEHVA